MREVFTEDLPRRGKTNQINWMESIGYKVKFIYEDIEGELEIIDCKEEYLDIKYINNDIFRIKSSSIKNANIGTLIGKITNNFKVEIGDMFKDNKRDLLIIDREFRDSIYSYQNTKLKWYKHICNICGWKEGWIEENALIKGQGCSCCSGHTIIEGINDVPTTALFLVKYFQGGYDEAKLYGKNSGAEIYPICPDCGKISDRIYTVHTLYQSKRLACICSDNVKFPEKFMYNFIEQLNLDFIYQLSKRKMSWCGSYIYDFYLNDAICIIETHGEQHYDNIGRFKSTTLEERQQNDKDKEYWAISNGIEKDNYIVINCKKSELEWIKNSIINSKLNNMFDLTNIDWNKCFEFALSNLVKKACDIKMNNPDLTSEEISKIMKLHRSTINDYLKKGTKLGWCDYDPKKESFKGSSKAGTMQGKKLEMFKDNISLGIFNSVNYLRIHSEELFGIKFSQSINNSCNGKTNNYKGYTFKYI